MLAFDRISVCPERRTKPLANRKPDAEMLLIGGTALDLRG